MEIIMEKKLKDLSKNKHGIFGTYIFGNLDEDRYIVHIDGADTRRGNLGTQCKKDREYYLNIFI